MFDVRITRCGNIIIGEIIGKFRRRNIPFSPFYGTGLFLYPLKIPTGLFLYPLFSTPSYDFRGYRKRLLA